MMLVTLWLVSSAEAFRVHGASTAQGAKGVQGSKRGRESTAKGVDKAGGAQEVCGVGDSPAACRELTAKYRGGGESRLITALSLRHPAIRAFLATRKRGTMMLVTAVPCTAAQVCMHGIRVAVCSS